MPKPQPKAFGNGVQGQKNMRRVGGVGRRVGGMRRRASSARMHMPKGERGRANPCVKHVVAATAP